MEICFDAEDAAQVAVGAFTLAVPVAFTQEAWNLGESLPGLNLAFLVGLSLIFLSIFAYHSVFSGQIRTKGVAFAARLILGYLLALMIVALVLFALNRLPLLSDPLIAIRRVLVVGMPASMGAIITDSFDKEAWTE